MLGNLKKISWGWACRIVEQMEKTNLENQAKIVTFEKWLIMTPN
jgi:hypothetical protein